jgi:hypothetical protein
VHGIYATLFVEPSHGENDMANRVLAPLALLALILAAVRYIGDPRPIDGLVRPLIALWFAGLGATYALLWTGHDLGRKLLGIGGAATAIFLFLDSLNILAATPAPSAINAMNWIGVGLEIALAVVGFIGRGDETP